MSDDAQSDAALLEASRGDERAFTLLVRRYVRAATMFAMQITGDRDDAEDVVQRAFIVVYEKSATFDAARPFSPWLFGIVRRLALKHHARSAARLRLLRLWHEPPEPTHGSWDPQRALAARIDDEHLAERARRALTVLSPMQRECFELVAVRAVATIDVAAMHGISEATVRQHVFRARRALRLALGRPEPKPPRLDDTDAQESEDPYTSEPHG